MRLKQLNMPYVCQFCNGITTWYNKKRQIFQWRIINNKYTCHKCYSKRRQTFKGERIRVNSKELIGICQICNRSVAKGEIKQTQFHHIEYHIDEPLKDTIEVCVRCHYNQHKETRRRDSLGRFIANEI